MKHYSSLIALGAATLLSHISSAQLPSYPQDYNQWNAASEPSFPYANFSVNTTDRAAVVNLWTQGYKPMRGIAPGWSGNIATGNAGTITEAFKLASLSRLNFFRAMAGVQTRIDIDDEWSLKDQAAALCFSAHGQQSHTILPTWQWYTADAAYAAALGNLGPAQTDAYILDSWIGDAGGSATGNPTDTGFNWQVGHRRALLTTDAASFGIGVNNDYAVGGVETQMYYTNSPKPRDEFVAWPAPGFVPYKVVYPRWHVEWPQSVIDAKYNGNLHMDSDTTVTVTRNGTSVPVYCETGAFYGGKSGAIVVFSLLGVNPGGEYNDATLAQLAFGGPNIPESVAPNYYVPVSTAHDQILTALDALAVPHFQADQYGDLTIASTRSFPDITYHVKIANIHTKGTFTGSGYSNEELISIEYDVTLIDPDAPTATAPVIVQQPVGASGTAVTLAVGVSGGTIINGAAPAYQWYKGVSGVTTVPVTGATNSYISVTLPQGGSAEAYWVRVRNTLGAADSATATVSPLLPPAITSSPSGGHFSPLNVPTLTVSATGSGTLTYQWLKNGSPIAGATSATYRPVASVDASYSCTVSNGASSSTTSAVANVTWVKPPSAVSLSTSMITANGTPITAQSSGENLRYQWYVFTLTSMKWVPAGNSPTTTVSLAAGKKAAIALYYCVVSNDAGSQASPAAIAMIKKKKKK